MRTGRLFAYFYLIILSQLIMGCSPVMQIRTENTADIVPFVSGKTYYLMEDGRIATRELAGFEEFEAKPSLTEPDAIPFEHYAPTIKMSIEELIGDNGDYEKPKGLPEPGTYRIIIDLAHQVVMVYKKGSGGDYTEPVRYMLCSSGKRGATPTGVFKMGGHRVRFGRFSIGGCAQYWSQITRRIYFHSILYNKKTAESYIKSAYNSLGTPVSHGCVRLTVPDARWIYYHIAPDTEIEIRKGSEEDALTSSIRDRLTLAKLPDERQKLVKGGIPNTDNWIIDEVPHEVDFEKGKPYGK
ncbi:MAG: putative L,D-transpeptidase YciB precursor [Firmicutes bacterium ADurb.Bin182]|nr:MAG: putative L,D-transpeptidase YciB precursor [Firmicutes bacterium ADurb.Bin182]